jgi:site-specific recombinase XerD
VFVRLRAPRREFTSSVAISNIVGRALERAHIDSSRKGAHLLRHSLATEMLRKGASLDEIGEVLRHCLPDTTAIYAQVDLASLVGLARRWPGGEP